MHVPSSRACSKRSGIRHFAVLVTRVCDVSIGVVWGEWRPCWLRVLLSLASNTASTMLGQLIAPIYKFCASSLQARAEIVRAYRELRSDDAQPGSQSCYRITVGAV